MKEFKNIIDAFHWVSGHPAFWTAYRPNTKSPQSIQDDINSPWTILLHSDSGMSSVQVLPMMVNPKTNSVDEIKRKNTKISYWVETGHTVVIGVYGSSLGKQPEHEQTSHCHDYRLDTCGDTWDEAIINISKNIYKFYGDYEIDYDDKVLTLTHKGKEVKINLKNKVLYSEWKDSVPWFESRKKMWK